MNMERLEILLQSKVIQEDTHAFALHVIQFLEGEYQVNKEAMEMMITHLVMAMERIKRGEIAELMDDDVFNLVLEDIDFEKARNIMLEISNQTEMEFPQSEEQYMLLHLCNSLKGEDLDA